jgi:hypothetical protein
MQCFKKNASIFKKAICIWVKRLWALTRFRAGGGIRALNRKQSFVLHVLQQVILIYCFQTEIKLQIKIFWKRSESELVHIMQGCSSQPPLPRGKFSCPTLVSVYLHRTGCFSICAQMLGYSRKSHHLLRNPEVYFFNTVFRRAPHWTLLHEATSALRR